MEEKLIDELKKIVQRYSDYKVVKNYKNNDIKIYILSNWNFIGQSLIGNVLLLLQNYNDYSFFIFVQENKPIIAIHIAINGSFKNIFIKH